MTTSAYRTVKWVPPSRGFTAPLGLRWPNKRPVEYLDFSLDLALWVADLGTDTIASVTMGTLQSGLQVTPIGSGFVGSVCSMMLRGGIAGTTYTVDIVVTTIAGDVADFPVQIAVVPGLTTFPTSPVLLVAGATWYNAYRKSFLVVPSWSALPATEPTTADQLWNDGGVVALPANSTLLPPTSAGLNPGDLWSNRGLVSLMQPSGLPTTSGATGTLWDNGSTLSIAS